MAEHPHDDHAGPEHQKLRTDKHGCVTCRELRAELERVNADKAERDAAIARAEEAEGERDALRTTVEEQAAALEGLSDFIGERVIRRLNEAPPGGCTDCGEEDEHDESCDASVAERLLDATAPAGRAEVLRARDERVWNECADWVEGSNLWHERGLRDAGQTAIRIKSANPYAPQATEAEEPSE